MHILILNWRDPKNPRAGGAEKLNLEIIKPLVKQKHTFVWYAMADKTLKADEIIDTVHVIRFGNVLTHFLAFPFFFIFGTFGKVDFIIDSIHGIGYMTPFFAPFTKKIILICEVAQGIWDDMWPFPISILGKLLEWLTITSYKSEKFWTISHGTAHDLQSYGVKKKNITVLSMGFDIFLPKKVIQKTKLPSALFVGRLAKMKGIEDILTAMLQLKETWYLTIIGRGDRTYEKKLKNFVREQGISKRIKFLGFVDEKQKSVYMGSSWVLLVPSRKEGWGMIVPEANAVGTQVIGYNVSGLQEVLPQYAKENICIDSNPQSIVNALSGIQKVVLVKERPRPGWEKLHRQIKKLMH